MKRLHRRDFLKLSAAGLATGTLAAGGNAHPAPAQGSVQLGPDRDGADPAATKPHIIYIVVDSLRADHLSSYGYGRATTPNFDALMAAQGVRFSDATSTATWTLPANASMFSGLYPFRFDIQWSDPDERLGNDVPLLAEMLSDNGYYTAGFIGASFLRARYGFDQGYATYTEIVGGGANRTDAAQINDAAQAWLQDEWPALRDEEQPLFLLLYYFDPHSWYNPPAPYDTLYDPTYDGPLSAERFQDGREVIAGTLVPTARDIEHLIALYDGEISYWDSHFGKIMAFLENMGLLDESIVVVTSDHGEFFGEHGLWVHGTGLYEEGLRVPLAIRYPGTVAAGQVVDEPVQTFDLVPTLLDWIGAQAPTDLDATNLVPLLAGAAQTLDRPLFSEQDGVADPDNARAWISPPRESRSVRQAGWKLIQERQPGGAEELYLMESASLYEQSDLLAAEPERAEALRQQLIDDFGAPSDFLFLPLLVK